MNFWTDERIEHLKVLLPLGLSASQIATELGATSRNAVIGKVSRLGLSLANKGTSAASEGGRAKRAKLAKRAKRVERRKLAVGFNRGDFWAYQLRKPISPPQPLTDSPPLAFGPGIPLLDLPRNGCKFGVSLDTAEQHLFCGEPRSPGRPYCSGHCAIAYVPIKPWKQKNFEWHANHLAARGA